MFILPLFASARPWTVHNKTVLVTNKTFGAIVFWYNNALEIVIFVYTVCIYTVYV